MRSDQRFEPGRTIVKRYWTQGRLAFLQLTTVLADDEDGLRLWLPSGSPYWRITAPDGRTEHDATVEELGEDAELRRLTWSGSDVMIWTPPGDKAYAVWWFYNAESGAFDHWYANLEAPLRRFPAGVDTADHALDIRAYPDGTWRWKDEGELADRIGQPGYWSAAEAASIRAEGERLVEIIEARGFPFDGTWCDLRRPGRRADSGLPQERLDPPQERPAGWDGPRAV